MKPPLPARRLIVFSGPQAWGIGVAQKLIETSELNNSDVVWHQKENAGTSLLGQDTQAVVINAYTGLNPDAVGSVSGSIIGGGALIILCPPLAKWHKYADPGKSKLASYPLTIDQVDGHYLARWAAYLGTINGIEIITPEHDYVPSKLIIRTQNSPLDVALTPDQTRAIEQIVKVIEGQRKRPALITADRGRGKSAALGLAAAQLLSNRQVKTIVVTCVGFANAGHIFKHAHAALENSVFNKRTKSITHAHGVIQYVSPDVLISTQLECDLLLVDEASGFGVQRLEHLLQRYSRIAFATTEHGYEGSGRGFSLKFKQLINRHCRGNLNVNLDMPIRWRDKDPLERWTNELLLLGRSQRQHFSDQTIAVESLVISQLKPSELANDEPALREVFSLLVDAHYQTRPADLRSLLDAPNSQLWATKHRGKVVGLIWLMLEGGLEKNIAHQIVTGERRPQGHLAPQIIAAHLGINLAVTMKCARVQRIVVSPGLQNKGIGQRMVKQLEESINDDIDYLASSFGADQPLLNFWHQAGYKVIRISDKANAASGLYSALMIKAVSDQVDPLLSESQTFFKHQFVAQLADSLRSLSPDLVVALVSDKSDDLAFSQPEINAAKLFAFNHRPYESTLVALKKIAQFALFNNNTLKLEAKLIGLLIMRCLQHRDWSACATYTGYGGKAECIAAMRKAARTTLQKYGDTKTFL